jgi:sulfate transport system permease protein
MRCTQTGKEHNAMTEQVKLERRKKITKIILVTVTVLFIFVMLVVPLFSVMASALKEGFGFYLKAISTSYVLSAFKVKAGACNTY